MKRHSSTAHNLAAAGLGLAVCIFCCGLAISQPAQAALAVPLAAASELPVYTDALAAGWYDWSWGGIDRDLANPAPVHGGAAAIAVTFTAGWSGLQPGRLEALDVTGYDTLRFWVHGGASGGQQVEFKVSDGSTDIFKAFTPVANAWTQVDVPLAELGDPAAVTVLHWFNSTPGAQPVFYLDDIAFVASGLPAPTPLPPYPGPALHVDAGANRHAISPYVYGMNFADEELAADLRLPVRRRGGNAETRYNWQNDTANHASDWYFENIPKQNDFPEQLPAGSDADRFVAQDRRTGAKTILTVPLIGWTPKSRGDDCGFSVAKYGAQREIDPWRPACGNGVRPDGANIVGNDPTDTSLAIDPTFVQGWMNHLRAQVGSASQGGVLFYDLDNEPMLWNYTHRDVHPEPVGYDELRDRTYLYAAAVKAADPDALTLGPVLWGWTAYFYSALDQAAGGEWWNNPVDRNAHGGLPFVVWYLQQMHAYEQQQGVRLLDYLDLHYYPQAAGVALAPAGNTEIQSLRLRTTRSLWDPTYADESWIAGTEGGPAVRLIPRMREWVDANYPGTKLAITEYNWGALDHINGALAQADVLGIFGREGLDLATLWAPPAANEPGAFAFRIYRNYDGAGGAFGGTSVLATSTDQDQAAIYAATRAGDNALTVMVINKATTSLTSTLTIAGFEPAFTARVYRYSAANRSAIVREPDQGVVGGGFTALFPARSITLFVLAPVQSDPCGQVGKNPSGVASGSVHMPGQVAGCWSYLPIARER